MNNDFSILIQGPPHYDVLKSIQYASKFIDLNRIYYSTWIPQIGENQRILTKATNILGERNIRKTVFPPPQANSAFNLNNIYFQSFVTLEGLFLIKTEFVIKIRSDEHYSNLQPLIDRTRQFPEKIVTSNTFFRKDSTSKYHPSDHLLSGRRESLHCMFNHTKLICQDSKNNKDTYLSSLQNPEQFPPVENILALAYLQSRGFGLEKIGKEEMCNKSLILMKKYFDVIPVKELGKFKVRFNDVDVSYTHKTRDPAKSLHHLFGNCIDSIDQL